VKVLAKGKLERKLNVSAHAFSARAREEIESAGGTCTVVALERGRGQQ
jgi:large subunit ribosomal protein L15